MLTKIDQRGTSMRHHQSAVVRLTGSLCVLFMVALPALAQQEATEERGGADRFVSQSSGAAGVAIPIPVPRGTGSFQPELSLRYSSEQRDSGMFGVGWQLGLSQIRRTTRFGIPAYDASDGYELDGELLVADPSNPGEYRSATESFSRITHDAANDSWIVEFPNGFEARFGTTPDTQIRLDGSTNPQNDLGEVGVWLNSELEDPHGNVIKIEYERSIDVGTAYPKSITYSYRGGLLAGGLERKVEFLLEPRPDVQHRFTGAIESTLTQRVREIRSTVNGQPFRRLVLSYSSPLAYTVHRSRLVASQLFGTDCPLSEVDPAANCVGLPERTFAYTDPATGLASSTSANWEEDTSFWAPDIMTGNVPKGVVFGDIDGDGRADLLRSYWEGATPYREIYLADETGSFSDQSQAWMAALDSVQTSYYKVDLSVDPCIWNISYLDDPGIPHFSVQPQSGTPIIPNASFQLIDLNDDGLSDLIVSWEFGAGFRDATVCGLPADEFQDSLESSKAVYLNTGSGWVLDANLTNTLPTFFSTFQEVIERSEMPTIYVAKSPNHLIKENSGHIAHLYEDDHGVRFAELNGDGRPDLLVARTDAHHRTFPTTAYLNTPGGWIEAPEFAPPEPFVAEHIFVVDGANQYTASSDTGLRVVDLNGDGLADLVKTALPSSHTSQGAPFSSEGVWLNTGRGWCSSSGGCPDAVKYALPPGVSFTSEEFLNIYFEEIVLSAGGTRDQMSDEAIHTLPFVFMDVNADGLVDLLQVGGGLPDSLHAWVQDPSNPANVWQEDDRFQPLVEMRLVELFFAEPQGTGARIVDTDHDGILDVPVARHGLSATYKSRMGFSDVLQTYENGDGGQAQWSYTSPVELQDSSLEAKALTDAAALGEGSGTGMVRWRPVPVVRSVTTSGVDAATATFDYVYAHPRWCPAHRSGLGFRIFQSTNDQDDTRAQIRYWQDHGRAGQVSSSRIYDANGIRHSQTHTWEVVDGSLVTGSVPGAHVGRLIASTSQNFDGSWSAPGALISTSMTIDDGYGFNFVDSTQTTRATGTVIVDRSPVPADAANWVVGLIDEETTKDSVGTVLERKRTEYLPGSAIPSRSESDVQLQEPGASLEAVAVTQRSFDVYGNLRSIVDPELRVQEFCYDGDSTFESGDDCPVVPSGPILASHSVVVGVKDRLGGVNSYETDVGTGETRATLLYNGDLSWSEVDAFGRVLESWVQPASHGQGTLTRSVAYFDGIANAAGQPYVERHLEVGDGSSIREADYLDGFGRRIRSVRSTPSGWAGKIVTRDYRGRITRSSADIDCGIDPHCLVSPPMGTELVRAFDVLDRIVQVDSPAEGVTTIDHSVRTYTPPIGGSVSSSYDVVTQTNPDQSISSRTLDGNRLVLAEECGFGSCGSAERTYYEYTPTGAIETIWNAAEDYSSEDNRVRYSYDTLGRVREIDDPDGGVLQQTFDRVGNLVTATNGRGQTSVYSYDALDRLEGVDRPGAEPDVTIVYNAATRKRALTYVGSDVVTGHLYDAFGRESRKVVATQGVDLITDFEYDLLGRATRIVYPDYTEVHYDFDGAYLGSVCGGNGTCTGDAVWVSGVQYDGVGREEFLFDRHGTRSYSYDPTSYRLVSKAYQESGSGEFWLDLSFSYDGSGRLDQVLDAHDGPGQDGIDASATMTYDGHGRLESWSWDGATRWFAYDALGNLTGRNLGSPSDPANQVYGDPGRPHSITSRTDTGKVYEYDGDGNATRRGGQYLTYDSQNQVQCVGTSPGACDVAAFGYDASGNLAYEIANGETRIFVDGVFVWNKTSNQAISHVFANGRQIGEQQRDNATLRTGWFAPGWEPPVDPEQILWGALASGAMLLLILGARSGAVAVVRQRPYRASTALFTAVAVLVPGPAFAGGGNGTISRRLVHHDHLGSRVLMVSDTPDVIYRRVFEPFGEVVAESTGTEGLTRYLTGKRESVATRSGATPGLINFGARWYDPEIGRFLSIDPIIQVPADPQTHNPYGYVRNNPINLFDPDGFGFKKDLERARNAWSRFQGVLTIYSGLLLLSNPYTAILGVLLVAAGVGQILSTSNNPDVARTGSLIAAIAGGASMVVGATPALSGAASGRWGGNRSDPALGEGSEELGRLGEVRVGTQYADSGNVASDAAPAERSDFDRAVDMAAARASSKTARLKVDTGSYVMEGSPSMSERLSGATEGELRIGDYRVTRASGQIARGGNIGSAWNASSTPPRNVRALLIAPYGASPGFLTNKITANADFYGGLANQFSAPVIVIGPLGARTTFSPN